MDAAVIFDMDGVLIDSYEAHMESWVRTGREDGVEINEGEFASQFGRTSREIIQKNWGEKKLGEAEIAMVDERKEALFRELIRGRLPVMPGAVGVIEMMKRAGWKVGIGSSGPPENVMLGIDGLGIRALLDGVVTGRDVRKGKPDPEVFLLSAQRVGVAAGRCVVIEDAPAGVEAAKRAGMQCIAFLSRGRARGDFVDWKPDLFIHELTELRPEMVQTLLEQQGGRRGQRSSGSSSESVSGSAG